MGGGYRCVREASSTAAAPSEMRSGDPATRQAHGDRPGQIADEHLTAAT